MFSSQFGLDSVSHKFWAMDPSWQICFGSKLKSHVSFQIQLIHNYSYSPASAIFDEWGFSPPSVFPKRWKVPRDVSLSFYQRLNCPRRRRKKLSYKCVDTNWPNLQTLKLFRPPETRPLSLVCNHVGWWNSSRLTVGFHLDKTHKL